MDVLQEFFKLCGELRTFVVSDFPWEAVCQGEKGELLGDSFSFCCFVEHLHKNVSRHSVHHEQIVIGLPAEHVEAY